MTSSWRSRTACSRRPRGQSRRTTLPKPRFDDIRSVAAPDVLEGEDPVDDRPDQSPAPARGRPIRRTAGSRRSSPPAAGPGAWCRPRVARFGMRVRRSRFASEPPSWPTRTSRPPVASEAEVARQRRGPEEVDHDVDALPARPVADRPRRNPRERRRSRRPARAAGPSPASRPSARSRRRCSPSRGRPGRPPCPPRRRRRGSGPGRRAGSGPGGRGRRGR